MLHNTAQERFEKLKKVLQRLLNDFNRDDLDDFVLTANSLYAWIQQDPAMSDEQLTALRRFTSAESLDWQICHQIANRQKHVRAKRQSDTSPVLVKSVKVSRGGRGVMLPSGRMIGAGEEIVIEYNTSRESALGFVIRTFRHFSYIFETAAVPPNQRRIRGLLETLGLEGEAP